MWKFYLIPVLLKFGQHWFAPLEFLLFYFSRFSVMFSRFLPDWRYHQESNSIQEIWHHSPNIGRRVGNCSFWGPRRLVRGWAVGSPPQGTRTLDCSARPGWGSYVWKTGKSSPELVTWNEELKWQMFQENNNELFGLAYINGHGHTVCSSHKDDQRTFISCVVA